jgi:hypothetical protein
MRHIIWLSQIMQCSRLSVCMYRCALVCTRAPNSPKMQAPCRPAAMSYFIEVHNLDATRYDPACCCPLCSGLTVQSLTAASPPRSVVTGWKYHALNTSFAWRDALVVHVPCVGGQRTALQQARAFIAIVSRNAQETRRTLCASRSLHFCLRSTGCIRMLISSPAVTKQGTLETLEAASNAN